MAKKKTAVDSTAKLLYIAASKTINTNTVLPILETILFKDGSATVTDLETTVIVPFKVSGIPKEGVAIPASIFRDIHNMGEITSVSVNENLTCTFKSGSRVITFAGDKADQFPVSHKADYHIGSIGEKEIEAMEIANFFVSKDDLRPAMTGIFFSDNIVATDAHRLYSYPIKKLGAEFIMPSKSVKILMALTSIKWDIYCDDPKNPVHVMFVNDAGVKVIFRVIDARYPDYKVVIPKMEDVTVKMLIDKNLLLPELKNASRFANKSTNQVNFDVNSKLNLSASDVDFGFQYHNEVPAETIFIEDKRNEWLITSKTPGYEGGIVSKKKKIGSKWKVVKGGETWMVEEQDLQAAPQLLETAFNGKYISEVLHKLPDDKPVEFCFWGPTKATVINERFLIMPLMRNS
jgi:DNA polymerase-3 subunit beta